MTRTIWDELFPEHPWPGDEVAVQAMADEIRALRILTDTIVTTALDEQVKHRPWDEVQRAHDVVGQYCVEMEDEEEFRHVSALCWVLRHDHNKGFAKLLETVEHRLEHMGFQVVRLPELLTPQERRDFQAPDQEKP